MMRTGGFILWFIFFLQLPSLAFGEGPMRCGNRLIEPGDTKFTVLEACGEPIAAYGSTWVYDQGPGTLLKILTFYQDELQSIQLGDRRPEQPLPGTSEIFPQP